MKKLNTVHVISILTVFTIGAIVYAASTPNLGGAKVFGILSSTYTNTAAGTTINGDLGYTTGPAVAPTVTGSTNALYAQAGIDQGAALSNLNSQSCTFTMVGPADLATDTTHGPIGVYTPGVYCITGAASIGAGGITLNGSGTYIFRMTGALTTVANSVVVVAGGASACDIFWTPGAATTLGANSTFVGTNIDDSGITIGSTVTWTGRALAFGGTVSTNVTTLTVPSCPVPVPPAATSTPRSSGGVYAMYPVIAIKKSVNTTYLSQPGTVKYTYVVTNPRSTPLTYVKIYDDKCPSVKFVSGDTNKNSILETKESWNYNCTMALTQSTTNIATASGVANGSIAYASAQATVTVGTTTAIIVATTTVVVTPPQPIVLGATITNIPKLPNAGFPPESNTSSRSIIIMLCLGTLPFLMYAYKRKVASI